MMRTKRCAVAPSVMFCVRGASLCAFEEGSDSPWAANGLPRSFGEHASTDRGAFSDDVSELVPVAGLILTR
jgi:hypothetical protein